MKALLKSLIILSGLAVTTYHAQAQLNPLSAQYFTNQYLANPAFAGYDQGVSLNAAYRQLWNTIPGAPVTQSVTAEYNAGKVGLGINFSNEKQGLQKQTRILGTYAYHLHLNEEGTQLNFGASLGVTNQSLESSNVYGDPNDILIGAYNQRKNYLDGDFGAAYTSSKLNLQAAIPNLKNFFNSDMANYADLATFYTAASYKFKMSEGLNSVLLEPKVALRGVKGHDSIIDAGGQASFADEVLFVSALYHSSQNMTFAAGINYNKKLLISGAYTSQTAKLSNYTNGSFELNLRLRFGN